jgi:hypothetical protein
MPLLTHKCLSLLCDHQPAGQHCDPGPPRSCSWGRVVTACLHENVSRRKWTVPAFCCQPKPDHQERPSVKSRNSPGFKAPVLFQTWRYFLPQLGQEAASPRSLSAASCPTEPTAVLEMWLQTDSKCADSQIGHIERAIFSYKDLPLNHILCTISGF